MLQSIATSGCLSKASSPRGVESRVGEGVLDCNTWNVVDRCWEVIVIHGMVMTVEIGNRFQSFRHPCKRSPSVGSLTVVKVRFPASCQGRMMSCVWGEVCEVLPLVLRIDKQPKCIQIHALTKDDIVISLAGGHRLIEEIKLSLDSSWSWLHRWKYTMVSSSMLTTFKYTKN